jgi:putative ABC transport system permease protein
MPRLLIVAAAWLVPSRLRPDWREEWLSELWHLHERGATRRELFGFAAGAFRHAWAQRSRGDAVSQSDQRPHWTFSPGGAVADLFDGMRSVRRAPAFLATTVVTLGVGMAVNVAVWSVVSGVMIEPLPYPNADRVVRLGWDFEGRGLVIPAMPPYKAEYLREHGRAFEALTTWSERTVDVGDTSSSARVSVLDVSPGFLPVVGFGPQRGRGFAQADHERGAPPVAMVTEAFLRSQGLRFGGAPITIALNGVTHDVIGVLSPDFDFAETAAPPKVLVAVPASDNRTDLGANSEVLARVREGVTIDAALADADRVMNQLRADEPSQFSAATERVRFADFRQVYIGENAKTLWMLAAAVTLVWLVTCANVANLLIARGIARHKEMAVRASLGASRLRLTRQAIGEGLLLTGLSSAVGLGLGLLSVRVLISKAPDSLHRLTTVSIDWRVAAGVVGVALITGIAFGLVGAWPRNIAYATRAASRGSSGPSHTRARKASIVLQTALVTVLLAGASLLLTSLITLWRTDLGFTMEGVTAVSFHRWPSGSPGLDQRLRSALEAVPGVKAVATTSSLPLASRGWNMPITVEGRPDLTEGAVDFRLITGDYFGVLKIPVLRGRGLDETDLRSGRRVVVLNQSLAERYWPGANPIGQRILVGSFKGQSRSGRPIPAHEVIGVVGDIRERGPALTVRRTMYLPAEPSEGSSTFVVSAERVSAAAIRDAVARVDSRLPPPTVESLDERLDTRLAADRFLVDLMMTFAAVTMTVTAIGVYGVVSLVVRSRRRDLGIRLALGAAPGQVVRQVTRDGFIPVAIGLATGLIGASQASTILASRLHGTSPTDPRAFAAVAIVLIITGTLASWLPARRVTRIDAVEVFRNE